MSEPAKTPETKAEKMIRRMERNQRKARAEGFMLGVTALLKPGDLVLDCGANVGAVTTLLAATGADVIAFEPDPYAFGRLEEATAEMPNVTRINAAVGVEAGQVELMRAENFDTNPSGASVKSTIMAGGRSISAENAVEVPVIAFPDFLREKIAERGEIAFVKMDIEGAELDILEAMEAAELFGPIRCLVAETHERKFKDLRPRFKALRQRITAAYPPRKVNLDWI
ncbi:FkbM family methyltransferase [Maritimibacter sp. 55A14]|uniref:FkbM family methyltransferase n=1 Tax=Maritimibacter sp. 55A14 TaxID=2174844 RepID=UPI000D61E794|nr:FkbM family methyltransferase [Maritimibacter sp. 55A14]PWE33726.1 FkbM family methyltransferase [Maritimibacter sp. 55A14]